MIVDDELAFVGGIDLTTLAGDRFDDSAHRSRDGISWHDAACLLRGPAVADVADHFALRWRAVTGESLAPAPVLAPCGSTLVQVARTIPERVYDRIPAGDFSILGASRRPPLGRAARLPREPVPLVTRDRGVLADKLRRPPTPQFRLVVVLPARPNNGGDDTRGQLGILADADARGHRFLACTLYSLGPSRRSPSTCTPRSGSWTIAG